MLDIEKFNPGKAELVKLAKKYKGMKIKGVDDKEGYLAVDAARKDLKAVRCKIENAGKAMRAEAVKFQKDVIARANEYTAIIRPLEEELLGKQTEIDEQRDRIARKKELPARREALGKHGIVIEDDVLLGMSDSQFKVFAEEKIQQALTEKENALRAREEKVRAAELAKAQEEQRTKDIAAAEERARKQVIQEQKDREKENERAAAIEARRMAKNAQYKKWLKDNGYTEKNKSKFYILKGNSPKGGTMFTIYKSLSSIIFED